ncbi:hypothetical protein D8674_006256 [Pyrus ussuriensis x Pyrus communis]|uniref:Uncharacterized protein n=1 Tax=Pyrus ussuriensis x Pyrus communis TaxID=2448454 RepID=A0A5N5FTX2_9ROSA|nr:hypothetical protein D8674_006256 [Pyrus ussuriensis x Pyrus communis]
MDNPAFVAAPSQELIVVAQVPGELLSVAGELNDLVYSEAPPSFNPKTISKACKDSQVVIDMVDLEILSKPTDAGSVSSAFTLVVSSYVADDGFTLGVKIVASGSRSSEGAYF